MMEENKPVVALSSDFLTAFAALPRKIQGKTTEFINKFKNNPTALGINFEKIHSALDDKICSVRIDDTYRGIVVRQEETGVYLLLWVDHHDEAYTWAARKRCDVNRLTGNIQVFDVVTGTAAAPSTPGLLSMVRDEDLVALGVPDAIVPYVRGFSSAEDFYLAKPHLPSDVYEVLEYLVDGFPADEVIELFRREARPEANEDDLAVALQTDGNRSTFVVVEGEDELRRIMAEPLEKWRIFLHPAQRRLVAKRFSGPASVLGGAGTGKTVTAMHRAKHLASAPGNGRILFTTFTANLAGDIRDNLRKICNVEEMRRIDVIHLDEWVAEFLRQHEYTHKIEYDNKELNSIWDKAIAQSGENTGLNRDFYTDEWSKVVAVQDSISREAYLKASRVGRGTRLDRAKRAEVWAVFEEYLALIKERRIRDIDTAMHECRAILKKRLGEPLYSSVVVDEGQDFGANAYRLLRAIAGTERRDDIFIVGDPHQRVYKRRAVLSQCGVNVRGRSSRLRVNYRTTEETRKYAFAFLKDMRFDNLDGDYEGDEHCHSLTHGDYPFIKHFKSAADEFAFIKGEVLRLVEGGVQQKDICLVARTHNLLDDYLKSFRDAEIRAYEIKGAKPDDRSLDGIRVATMHRVKGLEFQYVFVAAANSRVIPLAKAIDAADEASKQESLAAEKCLLYVALTRAQKAAFITSYGKQSEFLPKT